MPENEKRPLEYPKINTFTAASARRLAEEDLTFPEMYPHEVAAYFGSDMTKGLTVRQVKRQRAKYGVNTAASSPALGFSASFRRQTKNLLTVFLFFTLILFYFFRFSGELLAVAAGLAAIGLLNALLEHSAGKSIAAAASLSSPRVTVMREKKVFVTDSRALVPGDIILLESGNIVPADARLMECASFTVLETPVSGEKSAVQKDARFLASSKDDKVYANMVYAGTIVTGGNASAVVCATGANLTLRRKTQKDPRGGFPPYLKTALGIGRTLSIGAAAGEILFILAGAAAGALLSDIFIAALALGAASLCDTAFALSAAAMGKGIKDAIKGGGVFKNLASFRNIAEIDTVLCGKETAFLPKEIVLNSVYDCSEFFEYNARNKEKARAIIRYMLLCSSIKEKYKDKKVKKKRPKDAPVYEGSAFTLALLKAAEGAGYSLGEARENFYRIETEYDGFGEMCRVLGLLDGKSMVIVRGSPENVLKRCAGYRKEGKNIPLDEKSREKILSDAFAMAQTKVPIAVAAGYTAADSLRDMAVERKLVFLGFLGFYTSLEVENASAVFKCAQSGIETVAFTDDSYYTALNMAKNAGIIAGEDEICTARMISETEEGLFIANNEQYKLFVGCDENQLLYIQRLRKQNRHQVGAAVSRIEHTALAAEAHASFAASGDGALAHACDTILLEGGFDAVAEVIKQAKLITKRIADTLRFMPTGFFLFFFWGLFSLALHGEIPFGAKDVFIFGMFVNIIFSFPLSFAPSFSQENRKILAEKNHEVTLLSAVKGLFTSAAYSAPGALLCVLAGKITHGGENGGIGPSLITFTSVLFLFSLMTGKSRSIFTNKFYRNYYTGVAFVLGFGITAFLTLPPAFPAFFGYERVPLTDAAMAASLAFIYFLCIQLLLLIKEMTAKNKKKEKETWRLQKIR